MQDSLELQREVLVRLENDLLIDFKVKSTNYLSSGKCPSCGKREAFVTKDQPWVILCNRLNNCGERTSVRTLYEDIFTEFSQKYAPIETDPNHTARMYLKYARGFDVDLLEGMYEQSQINLFDENKRVNGMGSTIRFQLPNGTWDRLIDKSSVKKNAGRKNRIEKGASYKNTGWQPPGQVLNANDRVWITEGIFKSLSFLHLETPEKTIAAISANNFPLSIVSANSGKGIVWVLAYDNDKAGLDFMAKYRKLLEDIGESYLIALPPIGLDWDDLLRLGSLDDKGINEALYRGREVMARTYQEKAFWQFCKKSLTRTYRFSFQKSQWRAKADEKRLRDTGADEWDIKSPWTMVDDDIADYKRSVEMSLDFEKIGNCVPSFRYIEHDHDDRFYVFKVEFSSGNKSELVAMEGSCLESRSSFAKALLSNTNGGTFDGNDRDLKFYRDIWLSRQMNEVQSLPFVGYDKQSEAYIFPKMAYHKGRMLPLNDDGYVDTGRNKIKTRRSGFPMQQNQEFDGAWIKDFITAFTHNGLATLAWWLGTLFAEQIRTLQKSWPFLELTGDQGAGKSTIIEFLWRTVGLDDEEGFDPSKSTHAGRAARFVQVSNLPVVLIEGDRNGDDRGARKGMFDMDELKTAYNGRSFRSIGTAKRGLDTEDTPFRGGIMLSQNATVDGSEALLARIVHCHCDRAHFSPKTTAAVSRLTAFKASDLAGFLHAVILNERKLLDVVRS